MSNIECPICLHIIDWEQAALVTIGDDGTVAPPQFPAGESAAGRRMRSSTAYRTCTGRDPAHYLPADYGDQDVHRITIGIIGNTAAGKSHLLAAMIGQFMRGAARLRSKFGLLIEPLDMRIHVRYLAEAVRPFLDSRKVLDRTRHEAADITDAFLVTSMDSGARYAIIFIDMSGELLARGGPADKEFLGAVGALVFVVDPQAIRGLAGGPAAAAANSAGSVGDQAFDVVLNLLRMAASDRSPFLRIPSATVVAKSDLLTRRGHLIVDRWMRAEASDDLDLGTVEEESEDVFTYLYARGAERWLDAAQQTAWSTLHFASAAGTAPREDGNFPEMSFQPRRVIKPLLSLLAMNGVIDPSELFGMQR